MDRRTFVAGGIAALTAGTSGCLDALSARRDPGTDETPRYPDDREVPAGARTHDLYVENFDAEAHRLTLTVVRAGDDALLLRNTYEAPSERGFVISDLLVEERTYEIAVDVADGDRVTAERTVDGCSGSAEGGSANVGAWIEDGAVTFHRDRCDEIVVGAKLAYGDHERFVVE